MAISVLRNMCMAPKHIILIVNLTQQSTMSSATNVALNMSQFAAILKASVTRKGKFQDPLE